MPYTDTDFKETNINYINKDFASIKNSLIEYAKSYFPSSYRDFNETSPGMMLLEMSAYVGDVLSFYMDQQYREMLLPLAEERRNIITIANMLGYKVKPVVPAVVNLTITQTISALGEGSFPDYDEAVTIEKGMQVQSSVNSDVKFETLDVIDFTISGSTDPLPTQASFDDEGIAQTYDLVRYVAAVSGETKTKSFSVGAPVKFLRLELPETNVIDIISVRDSSGNIWRQVDYLAQDKVPIEQHYAADSNRTTAYTKIGAVPGDETVELPVPYTLEFVRTSKRFVTDVGHDGITSIVFGNGILRSGQTLESDFLQSAQVGITVPGATSNLATSIDPLLGDEYSTLGETPSHTTITVSYRTGGGVAANIPANDLTTINTTVGAPGSPSVDTADLSVTNDVPARGGSDEESIQEIRERASAFFTTQNRCVTKKDYEARILNMPSKFGNIAKVYVERNSSLVQRLTSQITSEYDGLIITAQDGNISVADFNTFYNVIEYALEELQGGTLPTIDVFTLSYNSVKELVETPADPLGVNLKTYLSEYRMMTDEITLRLSSKSGGGFIINFGVYFDIIAHRHASKPEVKFKCIDKIKNYFNIDKMQFKQPLYISQLEYELMGVDGVRAVNYVCVSQHENYQGQSSPAGNYTGASTSTFGPLYTYMWSDTANVGQGGWIVDPSVNIPTNYGYKFDFQESLEEGVIRPSATPAVFELKNPEQNIKGAVR